MAFVVVVILVYYLSQHVHNVPVHYNNLNDYLK